MTPGMRRDVIVLVLLAFVLGVIALLPLTIFYTTKYLFTQKGKA